ncbi:MAG: hypothetical protein EOP48_19755 [Sphingobacteriales bacterium]|nr:MAG: hypothetical protein EOP48_19755 [Sphingobacteriales bacterium]
MERLISYNDIKANYENSWHVPYDVLLNTVEWREFRQQIIDRDDRKCMVCHSEQSEKVRGNYFRKMTDEEAAEYYKEEEYDLAGDGSFIVKLKPAAVTGVRTETPTILHVHHKYYIFGNTPWEYKHDALMTVCHDCHVKIHEEKKVPFYIDETQKETLHLTPCSRCKGTGFLSRYHYFQNGICFRCDGRKYEEFIS